MQGQVSLAWRHEHAEFARRETEFFSNLVAAIAESLSRAHAHELQQQAVAAFQRALLPDEVFPTDVEGDDHAFQVQDARRAADIDQPRGHAISSQSRGELLCAFGVRALRNADKDEVSGLADIVGIEGAATGDLR